MTPDWIAVDWGTSNVRTWAMGADGTVLAEAASDQGMSRLSPGEFEPALRALIAPWGDPVPVIACGMVGARQGWTEAAYGRVPGPPLGAALTRAPGGLDVRIVPGLSQDDPPDVMRGEETKVAGFLAANPGWDGTILMPGTHPKWVAVSAGEVTGFRSSLTGEMYAVLGAHSVLRHSVGTEGWDDDAFTGGLADGLGSPGALAQRLFGLRAASLLRGATAQESRARLSGLLIGADLAGARGWWLGTRVALIGAGELARVWGVALRAQGVVPEAVDATAMTLGGLTQAWRTTS